MSLLSIVVALVLEQIWPLESRNRFFLLVTRYANYLERHLNAGRYRHGVIAWLLAMIPICILIGGVYYACLQFSPILAWVWNVIVLYLTMGFRHFSHAFTGIAEALQQGDIERARQLLADWTHQPTGEMSANEVSRMAIEQGLIDSHRFVFATLFWFLLLPSPIGAVLYRLSMILYQKWGRREATSQEQFGCFAATIYRWIDWIPLRLTAVSFAIMGDFEDAIYCWRVQAQQWTDQNFGILLASGAGAIGIRLGEPLHQNQTITPRPELGLGEEANPDYLQSAVGLIWRSVLLWLAIIFLLSFSHWVS